MSIIASIFGILIYLIRFIKGMPKFGCYILWGVVFFRLVCPFGISSEYSLLSMLSRIISSTFVKTVTLKQAADGSVFSPKITLTNTIQGAATYEPFTYKTDRLEGFFKVASAIWLIVGIAAIISVIIMYHFAVMELKKAVHLRDNIYEGSMVETPTVYGIIKPQIVIPGGIGKEHMEYILAHENVHIKRRDNIWRMLAIITACIHWFNPFIWLFLGSFLKDCELACDERAVKTMAVEERKNYARTLLTYGAKEKTVFASAFGSSKVKVRIKNVLSYRKLTLFSTVCFIAMLLVLIFILITNAKV
jgi:beta-lactamase regulating signal transducer with metallopeptidase domain